MIRKSQTAGMMAIISALLIPSGGLLPQVLAGLGALSILSASCLIWLEQSQPLFAVLAVAALAYEGWLVWRQPAHRRTKTSLRILWTSVAVTSLVFVTWAGLWLRYR